MKMIKMILSFMLYGHQKLSIITNDIDIVNTCQKLRVNKL